MPTSPATTTPFSNPSSPAPPTRTPSSASNVRASPTAPPRRVFDRALGNAAVLRNRLVALMIRLKKYAEKGPKSLPPLETQDLSRTPQDPSSFEPSFEDANPPTPEPIQLSDSFEPATSADPVDLSQVPAPVPAPAVEPDIVLWAKQNFGFIADPLQTAIMTDNSGRTLMLGTRQTRKSTAAALAAWQATRQCKELLKPQRD